MGEIADMMLDGTMCAGCGVWMDDGRDGPGFQRYCFACLSDQRGATPPRGFSAPRNPAKVACPTCGRHVKATGLKDHQRDLHGVGKDGGHRG